MTRNTELKIESSPEEMYRVEQFVEDISDEHLLYGNYYSNILMAVSEAVKNAIIHGNRSDRNKRVRIFQQGTQEGLWISILDEGEGFDYNAYVKDNIFSGEYSMEKRGLILIHKLADEVRFKENGRLIEMLFRINGIEDSIFERRVAFMQDFFRVYKQLST